MRESEACVRALNVRSDSDKVGFNSFILFNKRYERNLIKIIKIKTIKNVPYKEFNQLKKSLLELAYKKIL